MTTLSETAVSVPRALIDVLRADGPVILCGHARPDGDSIGSVMAMAAALRLRGRQVRTLCSDPAPSAFLAFPRMDTLEIVHEVDASGATVIVMESGALTRTGIAGLERAATIVNIDHHLGNTGYGTVNWFDEGAAACVELVADAIDAIDVAWTSEIATYLYLGLNTDTGSFRHSHITARSFELARRCVLAGADPVRIGQVAYDSFSLGRVRLIGELLHGMQLEAGGRLAVLTLTPDVHARAGSSPDETEGLINLPVHGAGHPRRVPAAQRRSGRDPRQPALEGRRRRSRGGAALWRRRAHECQRLHVDRPDRDGARHAAAAAARRPQVIPALDGVLIVDKPEGMTSHDVVATVRRRLPRKTRVGHTGTLDPFATGVLPVVIGKATRLSQFLTAGRKRYRATVAFGTATDTGDRMGVVIDTASPDVLRDTGRDRR